MSSLLDRSGRAPAPGAGSRPPGDFPASPLVAGLRAAAQAAAASLVVVLVPVVLSWASAAYSSAPWGQAVRFGVDTWLLAHHTGIAISHDAGNGARVQYGHVGLMPIGLTLVPLVCCWFAGVRLARTLDPHADAVRDGVGRHRPSWPPARALAALVLGYGGLVVVAGAIVTSPAARPLLAQAFVGAVVISALGAGAGAAAWLAGGLRPGLAALPGLLRLPPRLTGCLRPAAVAVGIQLAAAGLLFLLALVLGWHRVLLLHHSLAPGLIGGLVLLLAQLTALPNLVLWAGAWLAGPGFAVGAGTSVMPSHTVLGALPAVPALGILPSPGSHPGWFWAVLAIPVAAGAVAGSRLLRHDPDAPARRLFEDAGLTSLLIGLAWAVLTWVSGGPAGPGRLATMGGNGGLVGLAVLAEAGLGVLVTVATGVGVRWFEGNQAPRTPAAPSSRSPLVTGKTLPVDGSPPSKSGPPKQPIDLRDGEPPIRPDDAAGTAVETVDPTGKADETDDEWAGRLLNLRLSRDD